MVSDNHYYIVSFLTNLFGVKFFVSPKQNILKEIGSVLNTVTIFLEDDNHEEFLIIGEMLKFTLQLVKN